jgi:hypothetical protein
MKTSSSSRVTTIFGATVLFVLAKGFSSLLDQVSMFYGTLTVLTIIEAMLWFIFSRRYYQNCELWRALIILYGSMAAYFVIPMLCLASGLEIFTFPERQVKTAMLAQSLSLSFTYLFGGIIITPVVLRNQSLRVKLWIRRLRVTRLGYISFTFIGGVIACLYVQVYLQSGVGSLVGQASRHSLITTFETGKTWLIQYLFFSWLIIAALIIIFRYRERSSFLVLTLQAVSTLMFLYCYVSVGNRRELAFFLIFLLVVFPFSAARTPKLLFLAFPVLFAVGFLRILAGGEQETAVVADLVIGALGEFIFPHYPLIYYSGVAELSHLWGLSFFSLPLVLLPSFGFWEPVTGLGIQFSNEFANGGMGFAFTPLAEGYVNFGWGAVIYTPILLVLSLRLILAFGALFPIGALLIFSFALDICRGEFYSIGLQWLIFSLSSVTFLHVCRAKLRSRAAN